VAKSPLEAAHGADCVTILTDWPGFSHVDLRELRGVMKGSLVYDGRNMLQREDVEAAGLQYSGVGRALGGGNGRNGNRSGAPTAK
jgi:UDPglucose 6-dehydrogenase